jgi:hypothetical protein
LRIVGLDKWRKQRRSDEHAHQQQADQTRRVETAQQQDYASRVR